LLDKDSQQLKNEFLKASLLKIFERSNVKIVMEINRLEEIIVYLQSKPHIVWDPYPQYDGMINELLSSLGADINYQQNYEKAQYKQIDKLNLHELKSVFTFIARGERFCDGHIASFIEDGSLLKLAQRELVLLSK